MTCSKSDLTCGNPYSGVSSFVSVSAFRVAALFDVSTRLFAMIFEVTLSLSASTSSAILVIFCVRSAIAKLVRAAISASVRSALLSKTPWI